MWKLTEHCGRTTDSEQFASSRHASPQAGTSGQAFGRR
jgi:hypothetical protein